jgi:hypothetical protein
MERPRSPGRGKLPRVGCRLGVFVLVSAWLGLAGPLAIPGTASPSAASYCAETVHGKVGTWTRRPGPAFPQGGSRILSHAVVPDEPTRQYATNGLAVLATSDGCAWSEVFRLPARATAELPASEATDRVLEVVAHPRAPGRLWLVVAIGQDVAERLSPSMPLTPAGPERRDGTTSLVLHSDDAGSSWRTMETPPLPGAPGRLAAAPSNPSLLYLPTASGLHASVDGGRTWLPRGPGATTGPSGGRPLDAVTSPLVTEVAVDPQDPAMLHGRTSTAVRSDDGGLSWTSYGLPPGNVTGPFIDQAASAPGRLLFGSQEFSTSPLRSWWLTSDAEQGRLLEKPLEPGEVEGVPWRGAWNTLRDELLLATWDRNSAASFPDVSLYIVSGDGSVEDVDELDLPPVWGVLADSHGGYHLHTAQELLTLSPDTDPPPLPAGPQQVEIAPFGPSDPAPAAPATLGAPAELEATPGEATDLDVELALPRRPTPLDTYFLVDTSNSFEPDIDALAEGMADVVRTLAGDGVDAHFGLGELGTRDARRYRRFADIAAPGVELRRGFERLRTGGSEESHLIALHQTATGSGVGGLTGPPVAAGQAPTWRADSLRTVVVVTDVQFSDENDPEAPARAEVYDALGSRDVRVIGLEVVREGGDDGVPGGYAAVEAADAASTTAPTPARRDLEELAAATGSFAPPGGVDCRDNGTVEIAEGHPMVCTTTALHVARISTLSDVLSRVLLAQVDRQPVTLAAESGAVVRAGSPTGWRVEGVDVKRDQSLSFSGYVTCRPDQAGRRLPLDLRALVGGASVASTRVQVSCGDRHSPAVAGAESRLPGGGPAGPVGPGLGVGPQAVPALPLPPPAAPAPLGGSAPAGGTAPGSANAPGSAPGQAPAPGQAGAPGGAVAAAASDQAEEQVALATAPLEMTSSATPREPHLTMPTLLPAALLTAFATGALLHRERRRTEQRPIRNRIR